MQHRSRGQPHDVCGEPATLGVAGTASATDRDTASVKSPCSKTKGGYLNRNRNSESSTRRPFYFTEAQSGALDVCPGPAGRAGAGDDLLHQQQPPEKDQEDSEPGDLRPIVRDARAFSDKIARHPEKLGVRGLVDRSTGIK